VVVVAVGLVDGMVAVAPVSITMVDGAGYVFVGAVVVVVVRVCLRALPDVAEVVVVPLVPVYPVSVIVALVSVCVMDVWVCAKAGVINSKTRARVNIDRMVHLLAGRR
jgi:hypothetical protein